MQASPRGRFVAVKTEDQQARAMLFLTPQMFVGQRTQMADLVLAAGRWLRACDSFPP
jgi:hypothetical protein